ncbi:unnamed protein product [Rangifer tarandus platyrhynchus]|uniref:Uncharacterized protein n=1 Tax=Rangifer tarandus platyrhynchus TaxID=3082113 RepID=A0ACB1MK23_RANTA
MCTVHTDTCSTCADTWIAPSGMTLPEEELQLTHPPVPPVLPTPCTPRPSHLGSHQVLAGRAGSPRRCRCQGDTSLVFQVVWSTHASSVTVGENCKSCVLP